MKQTLQIGGRECLLYKKGEEPQVLLIQTLGAQERDSIDNEVAMISEASGASFVMAAFAIGDWEVELTPWHDPAVSKRQAVGEHAGETLRYVTDTLIPYLYQEYGKLPIVLGGYSLGGLFSLWSGSESDCFAAIAAMSPSVWIAGWQDYARQHPVKSPYVYLSLGDSEEHCRDKAIAGDEAHAHDAHRVVELRGQQSSVKPPTVGQRRIVGYDYIISFTRKPRLVGSSIT